MEWVLSNFDKLLSAFAALSVIYGVNIWRAQHREKERIQAKKDQLELSLDFVEKASKWMTLPVKVKLADNQPQMVEGFGEGVSQREVLFERHLDSAKEEFDSLMESIRENKRECMYLYGKRGVFCHNFMEGFCEVYSMSYFRIKHGQGEGLSKVNNVGSAGLVLPYEAYLREGQGFEFEFLNSGGIDSKFYWSVKKLLGHFKMYSSADANIPLSGAAGKLLYFFSKAYHKFFMRSFLIYCCHSNKGCSVNRDLDFSSADLPVLLNLRAVIKEYLFHRLFGLIKLKRRVLSAPKKFFINLFLSGIVKHANKVKNDNK
ncbi:hypothetical protein LG302_14165 [Halomonas organivorans]